MNDEGPVIIFLVAAAAIFGLLMGVGIGHSVGVSSIQQEAVNHGHALWVPNQKDGSVKFTWTPEEK